MTDFSAVTTGTHFILWSDKVTKIGTQRSHTVWSFCSNTSLASSWSQISSTHSLSRFPGETAVRILHYKWRHASKFWKFHSKLPGFSSSNIWLARRFLTNTCEANRLLRKTADRQKKQNHLLVLVRAVSIVCEVNSLKLPWLQFSESTTRQNKNIYILKFFTFVSWLTAVTVKHLKLNIFSRISRSRILMWVIMMTTSLSVTVLLLVL